MGVTVATIVKNEADRFLPRALECWTAVSDRIVAVDNGSTDATSDILSDSGAEVHAFETPMDGKEHLARAFLWGKALESTPDGDWIVWLDADQCVAGDFRPDLAQTERNRAVFRVYDLWTPTAYRSDAWWRVRPWWQAVRMCEKAREATWTWPDRGWHSGHVPMNAASMFGVAHEVRDDCSVLHYGYATPELRERHAAAYEARKDVLTDAELFHARTITDHCPRLKSLHLEPRWRLLP